MSALRKAAEAEVNGRGFDHAEPSDVDIIAMIERVARSHAERVVRGMFVATEHSLIFKPFDSTDIRETLTQQLGSTSRPSSTHAQTVDRIVAAAFARAEEEAPRG